MNCMAFQIPNFSKTNPCNTILLICEVCSKGTEMFTSNIHFQVKKVFPQSSNNEIAFHVDCQNKGITCHTHSLLYHVISSLNPT